MWPIWWCHHLFTSVNITHEYNAKGYIKRKKSIKNWDWLESLWDRRWCRKLWLFIRSWKMRILNISSAWFLPNAPHNRLEIYITSPFFKNSFFLSTVIELNNWDPLLGKSESFSVFKTNILKFIRPSSNSVYNCHNPRGICLITRLSFSISHLREHKFNHGFQDTINPLCSCGNDVEATEHFLLYCP